MLLAAVVLRDDVLYRHPFALESAEGSLVAVETCCPAGQGTFFVLCLWWDSKQYGLALTLKGVRIRRVNGFILPRCLLSVPLLA